MMENNELIVNMKQLPPGFRFDPTDEELVLHFLYSKVSSSPNSPNLVIPELKNFYDHYHPCQLHGEAFESYGQWYFYTRKTENRVCENGYWEKILDMDQPIFARNSNNLVGFKKCLVFYKGKFPSSGVKTGWLMQEYHACSNDYGGAIQHRRRRRSKQQSDVNKWVLCRVQHICDESQWMNTIYEDKYNNDEVELSSSDEAAVLAMEDYDQDEIISCPY